MTVFRRNDHLLRAFDVETSRLLKQRFFWFLAVVAVIYLFARAWVFASYGGLLVAGLFTNSDMLESSMREVRFGRLGMWIILAATLFDVFVFASALLQAARTKLDGRQVRALTLNFLILFGLTQVLVSVLLRTIGFPFVFGLYHVAACLILPWSAVQALLPAAILLGVNAVCLLLFGRETLAMPGRFALVGLSLIAVVPGVLVAWAKHSRRLESFRLRTLQTSYREMRRELYDAQRIHEALFPKPILQGPLRMDYRYEPMRQIGGDYLYARFSPPEADGSSNLNVLLLDVTGHGIAAALTVNRLYGEVERVFGEHPHADPGKLLSALNSYVQLTLANHSVYVTALCARINCKNQTLEYANGGHPPAFLCGKSGSVTRLDSTSFLLGVCASADFDPAPQTVKFDLGDTLVAYTDGALEARGETGKLMGIAGLERALMVARASGPEPVGVGDQRGGLAAALLSAVEAFRIGPPEDDTLVVEIGFCGHLHDGLADDNAATVNVRVVDSAGDASTIRA